jgi:hypothetical protein
MNIGQKTRIYTIEPVETPVPAEREIAQKEKQTEPQPPARNAPAEPSQTPPRR